MLMQGDLRAEKFDEGLMIPEDFEVKLEAMAGQAFAEKMLPRQLLHQAPARGILQPKPTIRVSSAATKCNTCSARWRSW